MNRYAPTTHRLSNRLMARMPPRLKRTAASFVAVFVAFCAYRLLLSPLIDPSFVLEETQLQAGHVSTPKEIAPADYQQLFPPGAWERNDPIVLENDGVKLLMQDYQTLDGGRIGLDKCTMLYFPAGDYQPEADHQRIVILRAPEGAVLQFDSELNLRRGRVGKLIGGQLKGAVEIRGTPSRPGADDDLFITTRDLFLDQRKAWTDAPVKFGYGPNRGHGRQLRIDLIAGAAANSRGPNISGLQQIELDREVEMYIQPGAAGLLPGDRDRKPSAIVPLPNPVTGRPEYEEPPVGVRCRGPFRFDFVGRVASFEDQVNVDRPMPEGPADQMKCDLLKIYFAPKAKGRPSQAGTNDTDSKGTQNQFAMEPTRMEATGNPVTIEAPSSGAFVQTNRIDYHLKENRVTVQSAKVSPDSVVFWGLNEYRGRDLTVTQPEQGRLATASGKGSGRLRAVPRDRPDQVLEASWTRELTMRPNGNGQHLISLAGGAETKFTEFGNLSADQIDIWLRELPRPETPADITASDSLPATPTRMLAVRNVNFQSAQLIGGTQRLDVKFGDSNDHEVTPLPQQALPTGQSGQQTAPPAAAMRAVPLATPVAAQQLRATESKRPLELAGTKSRFDLQGQAIDVRLANRESPTEATREQFVLDEATVTGAVRLVEIATSAADPAAKSTGPPLVMNGERLEIRDSRVENQARLTVSGTPAQVSARGMELVGQKIQLDRAANRLWIDGVGRTVLPARTVAAQSRTGAPTAAVASPLSSGGIGDAPVSIDFRGGMEFNGKTARFKRDVVATSTVHRIVADQPAPRVESRKLSTQEIVVTLRRAIDFAGEQSEQNAEVERINCLGGMLMDSRTSDHRGVISIDTLRTRDLEVLQQTGDLQATGPGRLESTRLSSDSPLSARLPIAANTREPKNPNELVYVRVDFAREVTGNLDRGQMVLHEDVQGIYGPIQRWGDTLPLESLEELGEGCVTFSSDQLTAHNVPSMSGGADTLELLAIGNAEFQGQLFLAQGHKATYADAKKQLSLEGDGRTPARIFYRPHRGGPQTEATAGKITYWLEENRTDVNAATRINLGQ